MVESERTRRRFILSALVITVLAASLGAFIWLNGAQPASPEPQPPIPPKIPGAKNVTGSAEGSEALNIALANGEVKQWLNKSYQLYGVFQEQVFPDYSVYWVCILTQEQQLPWVVGITLKVPVQFNTSDPIEVNFELTLSNLTQSQKEQTLRIASDTIKSNGGNASVDDVSVSHWEDNAGGKMAFHAYPCVGMTVSDNLDAVVYVDLEKGQVAKVFWLPHAPVP